MNRLKAKEEIAMRITLTLLVLSFLLQSTAFAGTECESDDDCPEGYECMEYPTMGCACPDCPEGTECPPCDCEEEPEESGGVCVEEEDPFDDVIAADCETDDDCPVNFTCQEVELGCETVPDCPPCVCVGCDPDDEDCNEEPDCECPECPEPEPCEEEFEKMCVFTPAECTADADCSEGFECVELKECWGSGSGGCVCEACVCPTCQEGEDCPPCDCPEEPVCECDEEPEFEEECEVIMAICLPKEIECEADEDCPEDFICAGFANSVDCACPGCACPPCQEGEDCPPCDCPPCDCGEAEQELRCIPEGWDEAEYYPGDSGSMWEATVDEQPKDAEEQENDEELEDPAPEDPEGEGGDGADETTDDGGDDAAAAQPQAETTGCAVGGTGGTGLSLLLLALAVLVMAGPRRRRYSARG